MKVLGITKERTNSGKVLRQGGTALLRNGRVLTALAEERVTRAKHAGGFEASLKRVLESTNTSLSEIDVIAISTCCEDEANAAEGHCFTGDPRLMTINHHYSHAALAFYGSGFDEALVVVADGGGNTLDACEIERRWWVRGREQLSYYLATRSGGIQLLGRDFEEPWSVGLGEMYRAFTYYLGWWSARHASRVMALSAYGRRNRFKGDVYDLVDGHLCCLLRNDPPNPISMVRELGKLMDLDFGDPRTPGDEILPIHQDIAAFAQRMLEDALLRKVRWLRSAYNLDALCLSGGVALNVVANGRLAEKDICRYVYVPPAPADDGQAVGNAMAAYMKRVGRHVAIVPISSSHQASMGPDPRIDSATVSDALHAASKSDYTIFENADLPTTVAAFLDAGWPVAVYTDCSEFGPRALGQRSILADPRRTWLSTQLNRFKGRDSFMPFAPAVLQERAADWFDGVSDSPFMSFAARVKEPLRSLIPGVVHHDGTARIQTVGNEDSFLRAVLKEFFVGTNVPIVLNTSFNRGGEPIVETVSDAIAAFAEMGINVMVLGRFMIIKTLSPELADFSVLPREYAIPSTSIVVDGSKRKVAGSGVPAREVIRRVQEGTGAVVFVRHDFPLYGQYLDWLREGRKMTTIRFRRGGVEVPKERELTLYKTADYGVGDRKRPTAKVRVNSIRYQRFGDLTADDAARDGFESLEHMLQDFRKIYPRLQAEDWVTLYGISLVDDYDVD